MKNDKKRKTKSSTRRSPKARRRNLKRINKNSKRITKLQSEIAKALYKEFNKLAPKKKKQVSIKKRPLYDKDTKKKINERTAFSIGIKPEIEVDQESNADFILEDLKKPLKKLLSEIKKHKSPKVNFSLALDFFDGSEYSSISTISVKELVYRDLENLLFELISNLLEALEYYLKVHAIIFLTDLSIRSYKH